MKKIFFSLISAALLTSCSNDFFDLEFENDSSNTIDMHAIATSPEYFDYLSAHYLFLNEALDIDTTKMDIFKIVDGKPLYYKENKYSYNIVLSKLNYLLESYPEFAKTSPIDQGCIMESALLNSKSLRNITGIKIRRTKFDNYDDAVRSLIGTYPTNGWCFFLGPVRIEVSTSMYAICAAISGSQGANVEHGGYGWSDGSGVVLYDSEATRNTMHMLNYFNNPQPQFSFHVHPDNVISSSADSANWRNSGIATNIIYDESLNSRTYFGPF